MIDVIDATIGFVESDFFRNLAVLLGILVAIVSIKSARTIAVKKQSADVIFGMRGDECLRTGILCIAKHHNATDSNIRAFATEELRGAPEIKDIMYVLNYFEAISIGIQDGIYSNEVFKRNYYSTLIKTYDRALPLIQAIREKPGKKTTYQELTWLVDQWKRSPLPVRDPATDGTWIRGLVRWIRQFPRL